MQIIINGKRHTFEKLSPATVHAIADSYVDAGKFQRIMVTETVIVLASK